MLATHTSNISLDDASFFKMIEQYNIKPDSNTFFKGMIDRGHKINVNERKILESYDTLSKTRGVILKTVFDENNFACNNFFIIMHEKYDIDYIKYKLIFDSILQTPHIMKNLYRYVWRHYQEIKSSVYHINNANKHEKILLWIIENDFKCLPEVIDDTYNPVKLQKKILDSFYTFSKSNVWGMHFILCHVHKYFLE